MEIHPKDGRDMKIEYKHNTKRNNLSTQKKGGKGHQRNKNATSEVRGKGSPCYTELVPPGTYRKGAADQPEKRNKHLYPTNASLGVSQACDPGGHPLPYGSVTHERGLCVSHRCNSGELSVPRTTLGLP